MASRKQATLKYAWYEYTPEALQSGVLSDKERELSTATMLASLGNVNPMFTSHTQGAFKNGNSKEELEEMALIVGKLIGKKEGRNAENIVKQVTGAK